MNIIVYENLFRKLIRNKHGMEINFEKIEAKLDHLRRGNSLAYSDLEIIGDESCWPFSKYWMWPSREQIGEKLKRTKGWFKNLDDNPDEEAIVIRSLDEIFKNIALVSIMLRFVFPKRYAIYSCPPLKILRIERGANDVEEYLNYVKALRLLRRSFRVSKTSDLDMIVWTIAHEKGEYSRRLKKLLADRLPENLTPGELITHLSTSPLRIAEIYLKQGAWRTSGFWAASAFEKIRNECRIEREMLKELNKLRNKAVHESEIFTKNEARNLIDKLRSLMPRSGSCRFSM